MTPPRPSPATVDIEVTTRASSSTPTSGPRTWPRARRRREGIDELTDQHWQVIRFMRNEYAEKGTGPTVRVLGKTSGVSVKELYQLFPKGPPKIAARIAGIPKPRGCI
jgi:TusE/DsrC/DsvC family sulfur relay protein